jgi:hypothetical protein
MEPNIPTSILHHPNAGFDVQHGSRLESFTSGVSWAAVAAGAFVAAAMSLILLPLGAGMGLAAVSPWAGAGASAATIGTATVIWLILMQFISSSFGGYVAGRLRTKWVDVHDDEVYFRDTAHGFLVWAVGLVISATFLISAAGSILGTAAETGGAAAVAAGAGAGAAAISQNQQGNDTGYFVDSLFRADGANAVSSSAPASVDTSTLIPGTSSSASSSPMAAGGMPVQRGADAALRAETQRILINGLRQDQFPAADKTYLAQQVAARTGLPPTEAARRVDGVLAQAQAMKTEALATADNARHAGAALAFWTFLSLLVGAFCASYAATIGGRQRDRVAKPATVRTPSPIVN